jgi:hypothetical protein
MKKLLALLLTLALMLSLAACVSTKPAETIPEKPGETKAMKTFTVTVVHADGTSKEFSYETDKEYVGPVLTEAGLIKGNDGPYGLEITHVDGEQAIYNTDKAYWSLYEGEEYALQGIDTTPVVDGGTYKLVYTPA